MGLGKEHYDIFINRKFHTSYLHRHSPPFGLNDIRVAYSICIPIRSDYCALVAIYGIRTKT